MKILFLIETLGNGGAERVLVNTLPELQKLGMDCEVAILFKRDDLAVELEGQGFKVHRLHLSYKWNVIEGVVKLKKLINNYNYDIIHAHLFFAYFHAGLVNLVQQNIKIVTTFHNLAYNTYPSNTFIKQLRKKLDTLVVNRLIDNEVAVSKAVKEHYSKHLHIQNVDLIFNSFPLAGINPSLDVNKTEVLNKYVDVSLYTSFSITPGRLVKEKGHFCLLDAMEQINIEGINLCHFIVGSGPLEDEIRKAIMHRHLNNVILIPGLPQNVLFDLVRACDFVIVPSVSEGFPMVVGECMALGKPIVATVISGVVDMIDPEVEGLLVPPNNSSLLAQAIRRLYSDKALQITFAENSKEKIKQFDTKLIAKQWAKYYEEMLHA